MFRRYKQRKIQLERLRLNNERRRLKAEEDERREAENGKMSQAARVIQKKWREHAAYVRNDINKQLEADLKEGRGQNDIVFMPSVRKCNLCRKQNAVRLCVPGVSNPPPNIITIKYSATLLSIVRLAILSGICAAKENYIHIRESGMDWPLSLTPRDSQFHHSFKLQGNPCPTGPVDQYLLHLEIKKDHLKQ